MSRPVTIARSSVPLKPPLFRPGDDCKLWFGNQRLRDEVSVAQRRTHSERRSKERHKTLAANATRRCAELESRLAELERRATDAEARVQHLARELTKCEKRVNMPAIVVVPKVLRQKVIGLVLRFHPDRAASTTPTEITKALNVLVEEIDAFSMDTNITRPL